MNSKMILAIVGVVALGCFAGQTDAMFSGFNFNAPGVGCNFREMALLGQQCMMPHAAQNFPAFVRMLTASECTADLINCPQVTRTQRCMAEADVSDACKANIGSMSDGQFAMLGSPCRVAHFQEFCRAYFIEAGLLEE